MGVILDYGDRPSKLVCRRIFVDALKRLQAIDKVSTYSYVGFGAYQFYDFDLIHRQLGITDMTSIESDARLIERCHFNSPYKSINIIPGTSSTILPTLDWERKTIVWLDYTQRLRQEELADCKNVALRLKPGSVFAITLNCQAGRDGDRKNELADALGEENVPVGVTEAKLAEWGLAKTQREILTQLLHTTLATRGDSVSWQQILNIHYRDGARMQTIAGIIDNPDIHSKIHSCRFEDMTEVSTDADPILIEIPSLTLREQQSLDQKLPAKSLRKFAGLTAKEVTAYSTYYRWLDAAR